MTLLHVPAKTSSFKKALVSYIKDSYTLPLNHPNFFGHSNYQESRTLIECLIENGYDCDVIAWNDKIESLQQSNYDLFIGIHDHLEQAKALINKTGKVVLYSTGYHWALHNLTEYERLVQLQQRRGIMLLPRRISKPILLEGKVDEIWYFGNEFQKNTYSHYNVPKHRINISIIETHNKNNAIIDENSRHHFLWFGSSGAVHKGLDWLLEIFPKYLHLHLHICGLVELEKDFFSAYQKELFELPNIHFYGWVLPNSEKYHEIINKCAFIIGPSCSEGGGGAILQCMSKGLIPVLSQATGIDTKNFGYIFKRDSIEEAENTILHLEKLPLLTLKEQSVLAIKFIQNNHTLSHYRNSIVQRIKSIGK
jgi:glycosyltransferase involved in cell wall biosynthesis